MNRLTALFLLFGLATTSAFSATNLYQGVLTPDNQVTLFNITVLQAEAVTIRTYSYGGGTVNSTVIPAGGFAPAGYLYDNLGTATVLFSGTCSQVSQDPVTKNCDDLFTRARWRRVLTPWR